MPKNPSTKLSKPGNSGHLVRTLPIAACSIVSVLLAQSALLSWNLLLTLLLLLLKESKFNIAAPAAKENNLLLLLILLAIFIVSKSRACVSDSKSISSVPVQVKPGKLIIWDFYIL